MDEGSTKRHAPNSGLLLCAILSLSCCDSSLEKDIRNLSHERVGVRLHAVRSLSRNRDLRSIEALNSVLNDPDTRVRLKAIEVLGAIRDPSSVGPLLSKIDDPESIIGLAAIEALGGLKDSMAVGPLSNLLTNTDPNVRMTALTALGDIGSVGCVEILSRCLNDENRFVRAAAILALKNIGDPSAIDPLTKALVREVQDNALSSLTVHVLDTMDPDWEKEESTNHALSKFISEYKDAKLTETKRRNIAATFVRINRHWTDEEWAESLKNELLELLNDENPLVREAAAEGLGEFRDVSILYSLTSALAKEPDWSVRADLLYALGEIGDARALEPLCQALEDSIRPVRFAAAAALGKIGDKNAVIPLINTLDKHQVSDVQRPLMELVLESPQDVRVGIAQALGDLKDPRSVDTLIELTLSRSTFVRGAAVAALGRVGDPKAVRPLIAALHDSSLEVRMEAVLALQRIGEVRAVHAILQAIISKRLEVTEVARTLDILDPHWREEDLAKRLTEMTLQGIRDPDLKTRIRAAEDLGEIANKRSTGVLMQELRNRNLPIVAGAYRFFIKRKTTGYEPVLVDALRFYGDTNMAAVFLKSRNARLVKAARNWARSRNLTLFSWPIKENLVQQ